MLRVTLVLTAVAAASTASPAAAQSRSPIMHAGPVVGLSAYFDRSTLEPREQRLSLVQEVQARRWQRVGQCVVARDRTGSVAFVATNRPSDAATRLKAAFATCLSGMEIDAPANMALRRAAVADALGVFVPAR